MTARDLVVASGKDPIAHEVEVDCFMLSQLFQLGLVGLPKFGLLPNAHSVACGSRLRKRFTLSFYSALSLRSGSH